MGANANAGVMCGTADGLAAAVRGMLEANVAATASSSNNSIVCRDHELVPLPWNEMLYLRSRRALKIGW